MSQPSRGPVVFVQPFSLGSPGGGPRILRALLENAPLPWRNICTSPEKPSAQQNEMHLPTRPFWGRIEYTRFAALPQSSSRLFESAFRRRLLQTCRRLGARAVHVVPHSGLDFVCAQTVARALSVPFFVSLHDDLAYTALDRVPPQKIETAMKSAWQEAVACFVISEALGLEYCRRYGERTFEIVTDGISQLAPVQERTDANNLRIYFMGLFHRGYEQNLRALLEGIALFERAHPETSVSVTLRCGDVRPQVLAGVKSVTILPFADEAQVQRDLENGDLLYLPLPFGDQHAGFARYSLSTKMVTYAGSGLPILYHGPPTSAASELLQRHHAAMPIHSLVPSEIAAFLGSLTVEARETAARNALDLARREFMLADQERRFWGTILACLKE